MKVLLFKRAVNPWRMLDSNGFSDHKELMFAGEMELDEVPKCVVHDPTAEWLVLVNPQFVKIEARTSVQLDGRSVESFNKEFST